MPLNDTYDFVKQAKPEHQAAFTKRYGVHRVLVKSGTVLCKLTEHGLVFNGAITPWWNYFHAATITLPNGTVASVPGFSVAQAQAKQLGATDEQFGRARSAVTNQWNKMTNLLKAKLNVDAYGWFGQNSGMPLDEAVPDPRKVMLIGGAFQVYIPNLKAGMMTQI